MTFRDQKDAEDCVDGLHKTVSEYLYPVLKLVLRGIGSTSWRLEASGTFLIIVLNACLR